MADVTSKTWFAVFNNPEKHGYEGTPDEILKRLRDEWCTVSTRSGAWAYCVLHYENNYPVYDENGRFLRYNPAITEEEKAKVLPDLHHVHMVLEDTRTMRFSFVKNVYAKGAHFEETKGTKKQAEEYISKTGAYSEADKKARGEPWEEIMCPVLFQGEIRGRQGARNDLVTAEMMIRSQGMRPEDVFRSSMRMQKHRTEIIADFLLMRADQTPDKRSVEVIWHMGPSRSGKSFTRIKLIEEYGRDEVFVLAKYDERGMFDGYYGQKVMIIDDFKGAVRYSDLLTWIEGYKNTLPARHTDRISLWDKVHITSIYHPTQLYAKMVERSDNKTDTVDQLLYRINVIRYHYRTGPVGSDDPDDYGYIDFPGYTSLEAIQDVVKKRLEHEGAKSCTFETLSYDDELPC